MTIEGVPEGYELVRIGSAMEGELMVSGSGDVYKATSNHCSKNYPVIRKLEPQYRPFANAAEFAPHRDRWIRGKHFAGAHRVVSYGDGGAISVSQSSWAEVLESCVFDDDGTPCGMEV